MHCYFEHQGYVCNLILDEHITTKDLVIMSFYAFDCIGIMEISSFSKNNIDQKSASQHLYNIWTV